MRYYITIIICLLIGNSVKAQKIETFGGQFLGIRNKYTKKVLIIPKYSNILDYNDSLIIVQSYNMLFAVIDTLDNILVPFSKEKLEFEKFDPEHLGEILEVTPSAKGNQVYFIDKNRKCIPYEYYPCPKGKQLTDSISRYLLLIQKGTECFSDNKLDSVKYFFDKAIEANPTNAYVYLSRATISMINSKGQFIKNSDDLSDGELNSIITNLDKAYALSSTPNNFLEILNLRRVVARYYLKDKVLIRKIDKESEKYNPSILNHGLILNTGVSYSNGFEMELGLATGLLSRNEKYWNKPYIASSALIFGCSYIKNITQKFDGYKFYFLSLVKPVYFSLCPILYTDYSRMDWVLRPELGLGYGSFSLSMGYNLFVNHETYKELNALSLNLKYYLPLNNNKNYSIRL
jgi:hypothetical protein